MNVQEYYGRISDKEFSPESERECLAHYFYDQGQTDYQFVAETCKKLRLGGIVDIECGYGYQSEIFMEKRLRYHGIDSCCTQFWNSGQSGITYQTQKYPYNINADTENMLAVIRFCSGYSIKDYESIIKGFEDTFEHILVKGNAEILKSISRHYIHVADLHANGEGSQDFSLFSKTQEGKECLQQRLGTELEEQGFHVCGLQFPGETGITANRIMDLFEMTEGYYFDLILVVGQEASAYFVMDSYVYLEWDSKGLIPSFKQFIAEILDDTGKENEDGVYDFLGHKVYLDYM